MSVRRSTRLIAIFAAAAAVFSSAPGAAADAADYTDCPPGNVCVWSETIFHGTMVAVPNGTICYNTPFPAYSLTNTHGNGSLTTATMYEGQNCTGRFLGTVNPGHGTVLIWPPARSVGIAV